MKLKYFAECTPELDLDFYVVATEIVVDSELPTADGSITIQIIGGSGPYTFTWSGPTIDNIQYPITNTTQNISGLHTGTYTVKVTDGVGNVTSGTFFVPGPSPTSCQTNVTNVSINNGNDGEISVDVTTGVSPYTITLTSVNLTSPIEYNNLQTGVTFTGLKAGNYKIRVTDSGIPETYCERDEFISEPTSISVTLVKTDVSCNGSSDGSITAIISGGFGPYKLLWDNGKVTNFIDGLSKGTYELTVTDANGQVVGPIGETINEPTIIEYDNIIITNGLCKIPSVTVNNISGGLAPYTITLEGGEDSEKYTTTVNTVGADALFTNLVNGTENDKNSYVLTIEDNNGCQITEEIEVFKPSTMLSANVTLDNTTNPSNPTIYLVVFGGIFNSNTEKPNLYSYRIQKQINTGNEWVDEGQLIDLGVSTIYSLQVTPTTPATKYRFVIYDKNKDSDSCSITTNEISI